DPDPRKTLKAQSRRADRLGARGLLFLGDEGLGRGVWTLKDMRQGTQRESPSTDLEGLVKELDSRPRPRRVGRGHPPAASSRGRRKESPSSSRAGSTAAGITGT